MSDPGRPDRTSRPTAVRGRIGKAPADTDSGLTATSINYSSIHEYEVPAGQWTPRFAGGSDVLPSSGDLCLIVFDDDGDAWVAVWSPSS